VGTVVGVLGGGLAAVESVAGAIFPVLFIGLAALAVTRPSHVLRAVAAAVLTAAVAVLLPDLRMLAPVIAGVLVALPGRES
jgi:predicted branched-subunit amino acid permease